MPSTVDSEVPGGSLRSASADDLAALRQHFAHQHLLRIPNFVDGKLLAWTLSELESAEFESRSSKGVGTEWSMTTNALAARLIWLMNSPELLRAVKDLTGDEDIGLFIGRVYRMEPSSGESFDWHDDRGSEERRIAVSVNLSTRPFSGGTLKLREKRDPESTVEVTNTGLGDAVLFQIAKELEHCVMPVVGDVPRVSFTGWYQVGPSYFSEVKRQFEERLRAPEREG